MAGCDSLIECDISGKKETNACHAIALKVVHDTGDIEMLL